MKIYNIPENGTLDLQHLMFVGEVFQDSSFIEPWIFHIQLAFNVDRHIAFDTRRAALIAREALITAWQNDI